MHKPDARAVGMLLTVQLLFGLYPIAAKQVLAPLGGMHLFTLLAVRVGGAAFFLLTLHLLLVRNPIPMRTHWPKVLGLAFLGVIANMGMFLLGLQSTTPTEAVLLITTIPVFTYAIAVALGRETRGPRRMLGILLAIAGVAYLTLSQARIDAAHVWGDLLIVGNALSYAAYLVFSKPLIERYDALSLTTWVFLIGAVVFLPVGFALGLRFELAALSRPALGWLAFIVLGPSVVTYVLNNVALRHVPASTVAFFTYVQPIFTTLATYLFAMVQGVDADLNWRALAPAAGLIFAGVWLVARRDPPVIEGQTVVE